MRRITLYFLASLLLCAANGCKSSGDDRRVLAVSIEPQRFLLERIAGRDWRVVTLLERGEDPENFEPTVGAYRSASDASAYFEIGTLPFEEKIVGKMPESVKVINCSEGIDVLRGTHEACTHHSHNNDDDHGHSSADPHIWFSLPNMQHMAGTMLETMIALDPERKPVFEENYHRLIDSLTLADNKIKAIAKGKEGASFIVWHPSLSYFAHDYGFKQIPLGDANKELSVRSLKDKIDDAHAHGASVFFVQSGFDSSKSAKLMNGVGVGACEINTLAYDLPGEMLKAAEFITKK